MHLLQRTRRALSYWSAVAKARRPRALYIGGWLHHDNLGDETLYAAFREIFRKVTLVEYPNVGGRILAIPNKILKPNACGFLAGGTLINCGGPFIRSMLECDSFLSNIFVFGTGVKDPGFWSDHPHWKSNMDAWTPLLQRCKYLGVRGPLSCQILREHGLRNAEVIGDPVLSLASDELFDDSEEKRVGICIGSDGKVWGGEEQMIRDTAELARLLRQSGWTICWYVVCPDDYQKTLICAEISGTAENIECHYSDYRTYLSSISRLTVFIGTRLHSVVLAICRFVPSIMLEYRPKCLDFMKSIGQEALSFRSDRIAPGEIHERVGFLESGRDAKSAELFEVVSEIKKKQRAKAAEIWDMIEP